MIIDKGPSINDISFEGEGRRCQKWNFEADFRAKTGVTEETWFMDVL